MHQQPTVQTHFTGMENISSANQVQLNIYVKVSIIIDIRMERAIIAVLGTSTFRFIPSFFLYSCIPEYTNGNYMNPMGHVTIFCRWFLCITAAIFGILCTSQVGWFCFAVFSGRRARLLAWSRGRKAPCLQLSCFLYAQILSKSTNYSSHI